ncbi:MAG TPA: hypothetical protein VNC50_18640 [Planctomycetia bacterium]|nr:hypothetical protein [Planctomycetia bacterium]
MTISGTFRGKYAVVVGMPETEDGPLVMMPLATSSPSGEPTSSVDLAELLSKPELSRRVFEQAVDAFARGEKHFILDPKIYLPPKWARLLPDAEPPPA